MSAIFYKTKMSNIGRINVVLPSNLDVKVYGWKLIVKGPIGNDTIVFPHYTRIIKKHTLLSFRPHQIDNMTYGSYQRKLRAFIYGLSYLCLKRLVFVGVGYRARLENKRIIIRLGYSHEISLSIPANLSLSVVKRNNVILKGNSLDTISQFAYRLRSFRQPEPFKGKGIVVLGENIRRKEGKKKKV